MVEDLEIPPTTHDVWPYIIYTNYMVRNKVKIFKEDIGLIFKSFKRRIREEKQDGDGRIQTGKSPISYNLYKRIN